MYPNPGEVMLNVASTDAVISIRSYYYKNDCSSATEFECGAGSRWMLEIEVERWSFWSPESGDPRTWLEHWRQPDAKAGAADPDVSAIPPMQRRRMSRLSKMALSAALDAAGDQPIDYSIFCSQHGEIVRTRQILSSISEGTEISPMAFAQSVHNTASGLFTIITASNAASTSIASGAGTFAAAWVEAQSYLSSNPTHRVLLVDFDEVIPDEYQSYSEGAHCDHALALVLVAADQGGVNLSRAAAETDARLPLGPQFLAWLQSEDDILKLTAEEQGWQWRR